MLLLLGVGELRAIDASMAWEPGARWAVLVDRAWGNVLYNHNS